MADAAKARPRCADCGLTFVLGERALNDLREPSRLHHEPGVCAERLLVLVDDVRERAARDRARLRAEINETLAERDQARHDFTAALVVVRAARVVRVRRWQLGRIDRRMWKLPSGPAARAVWKEWHEAAAALDRAIDVHRLALAAYVRGERR